MRDTQTRDALSRLMPQMWINDLESLIAYSGIRYNVYKFFSMVLGFTLWISVIAAFLLHETNSIPFINTFLFTEALLLIAIYSYLIVSTDKRGRFVESILPDVLKLLSTNLKSGLTIDKALVYAARPEFGFFQDEIKLVASKMSAGETLEGALSDMNNRIKSKDFASSINLIIQGIQSGGKLAESVDSMADILMDREVVKKEIKTGVQMYTTLVIFAIVGGAPVLFGISTFLIQMLKTMSNKIVGSGMDMTALAARTGGTTGGLYTPTAIPITVEFITEFALISLTTTAVIGSLVVALIGTGDWKRGIRSIPVFFLISMVIFYAVNTTLVAIIGAQFL